MQLATVNLYHDMSQGEGSTYFCLCFISWCGQGLKRSSVPPTFSSSAIFSWLGANLRMQSRWQGVAWTTALGTCSSGRGWGSTPSDHVSTIAGGDQLSTQGKSENRVCVLKVLNKWQWQTAQFHICSSFTKRLCYSWETLALQLLKPWGFVLSSQYMC